MKDKDEYKRTKEKTDRVFENVKKKVGNQKIGSNILMTNELMEEILRSSKQNHSKEGFDKGSKPPKKDFLNFGDMGFSQKNESKKKKK